IPLSQGLWRPAAALTFELVRYSLAPWIPTLRADPATLILRTDRFAIQVSELCSGLEGVGLMAVFCTAWLLYFRREYAIPRALLLIPCGMLLIFALNVLRIDALVLIGHSGFPEVARNGFHTLAGWIAFNIAACGVAFVSRRIAWLSAAASPTA